MLLVRSSQERIYIFLSGKGLFVTKGLSFELFLLSTRSVSTKSVFKISVIPELYLLYRDLFYKDNEIKGL